MRELANSDPKLLLSPYPPPLILDEIQYSPELLHYVKLDIDTHRGQSGRYVITGSQAFPLMRNVTESLAGRAAGWGKQHPRSIDVSTGQRTVGCGW